MMLSPHKGKTWPTPPGQRVRLFDQRSCAAAYRLEDAFRQEIVLAVVLIPAALLLPVAATGRAILLASVMLVLIVELLNSAIEAAVDRISLDNHELAKLAKDIGSAAVMLSLACMTMVWIVRAARPKRLSSNVQTDVTVTSSCCCTLTHCAFNPCFSIAFSQRSALRS